MSVRDRIASAAVVVKAQFSVTPDPMRMSASDVIERRRADLEAAAKSAEAATMTSAQTLARKVEQMIAGDLDVDDVRAALDEHERLLLVAQNRAREAAALKGWT